MGLDLTLLVMNKYCGEDGVNFAHTMLRLLGRTKLFKKIEEIEFEYGKRVPNNFDTYLGKYNEESESCYGLTLLHTYNGPLKYIKVKNLLPLSNEIGVIDNKENKSAWAYLKELPLDLRIALYWD